MAIPTSEELLYEQAKRSYDIMVKSIESYGGRYQRIFSINSAMLGFLFLITIFIINVLTSTQTDIGITEITRYLLWGMIVSGVSSIILFFISIFEFIPISKSQEFLSIGSKKLYDKYHTMPNTTLIEGITKKINNLNVKNYSNLKDIKYHYKLSLKITSIGVFRYYLCKA